MKHPLSLQLPRLAASALLAAGLLGATGCDKAKETATRAAAVAEVALDPAIAAQYGFAARVANDAEAFTAAYRLGELWDGFKASRWLELFNQLSFIKDNEGWKQALAGLEEPKAKQAFAVLRALFGEEAVFVAAPGTSAQLKNLLQATEEIQKLQSRITAIQMKNLTAQLEGAADAETPAEGLTAEDLKGVIALLETADFPPIYLASRAGAHRAMLDELLNGMTEALKGEELPPGVTLGTTQVEEKHTLQTLRVEAGKLIAANEEQFEAQLKQAVSDEAAAKGVRAALEKKTVEIAWGWVDDYFIVSAGPDTKHLKLAGTPATSILAKPAVAARAVKHAEKKPVALSFFSQGFLQALDRPLKIEQLTDQFIPVLGAQIPEEARAQIKQDAAAFDAKYAEQTKTTYADSTHVNWWDGGLRGESWGGWVVNGEPQPLSMAAATTPSTILHLNGRALPGGVNKRQWTEDFAGLLWGWYQRHFKATLPQENAAAVGMAEMMAVPIVKEIWRAAGLLSDALGDETAFVLDGGGQVPPVPGMPLPPSFTENARIPRLAWVAELKDRQKLGEAWGVLQGIINQLAAFAQGAIDPAALKPLSKTAGNAEIFWMPLIPGLDADTAPGFLPHTGAADTRWFISSAPSLTQELAGSPARGETAFATWSFSPPAVADWIAVNLKAAENSPEMKEQMDTQFQRMKQDLDIICRLLRSVGGLNGKITKEGGDVHVSGALLMKDAE